MHLTTQQTTNVNSLSNRLSSPYSTLPPDTFTQIQRLSDIVAACNASPVYTPSIPRKCHTSITEIVRDELYAQSTETRRCYIESPMVQALEQKDEALSDLLSDYLASFGRTVFEPIGAYFDAHPAKLQGRADDIIQTCLATLTVIQQALRERQSAEFTERIQAARQQRVRRVSTQNCITVIRQQFQIHPVHQQQLLANLDEKDEENDDDDDEQDEDDQYSKHLKVWDSPKSDKQPLAAKQRRVDLNDDYKDCVLSTANRLDLAGSDGDQTALRCIRAVINDRKDALFSSRGLEMMFDGNHVRVQRRQYVDDSILRDVLASRLNLYAMLSAVHCTDDDLNTLSFLYIVYYLSIAVIVYVTDEHAKRFGITRLNDDSLFAVIPKLFEAGIDVVFWASSQQQRCCYVELAVWGYCREAAFVPLDVKRVIFERVYDAAYYHEPRVAVPVDGVYQRDKSLNEQYLGIEEQGALIQLNEPGLHWRYKQGT